MGATKETQSRQMMWEFTPPPGVAIQQWQTSIRFLFKEDRLDEMLAWLKVQVQICEESASKGLFYNQQPAAQNHVTGQRRKPRPESIHHRRREPRRGTDDDDEALDVEQAEQAPKPKRHVLGNVAIIPDAPMVALSPGMAKPRAPIKPGPAVAPKSVPGAKAATELELENAELRRQLAALQGTEEQAPDTDVQTRHVPTMPPAAPIEQEEDPPEAQAAPDLSGPKVHRHTWSAGRYVIEDDNACVKCGAHCTGIEELCPVA